jgi:hypothetical protein
MAAASAVVTALLSWHAPDWFKPTEFNIVCIFFGPPHAGAFAPHFVQLFKTGSFNIS